VAKKKKSARACSVIAKLVRKLGIKMKKSTHAPEH
jgi:hypothetical protein